MLCDERKIQRELVLRRISKARKESAGGEMLNCLFKMETVYFFSAYVNVVVVLG